MRRIPLILLLLVSTATFGDSAATAPRPSALPVVDLLRVAMGLPNGTGDPMPALKDYQANAGKDGLDNVVNSILSAEPTAIRKAVLDHTNLQKYSAVQLGDAKWEYGSFDERDKLRSQIWSQGNLLKKSDPKKARSYFQASILFAAMDDFPMGDYALGKKLREKDTANLVGIKENDLKKICDTIDQDVKVWQSKSYQVAGSAVDRLFKHPDEDNFNGALKALDAWYKELSSDEFQRLQFAQDAQELQRHAILTKSEAIKGSVAKKIKEWTDGAEGNLRRWMTEASIAQGAPHRVFNLSVWKDGKLVDTDTDGNLLK